MYNPTRRNRNIGTAKQGYGSNNKLTIPSPCVVALSFYERLGSYQKIEKIINGHQFVFVIEATRQSCQHACSVSDIERIIENIPCAHYGDLKLIILRQPTRKQQMISPVWGRLIYSFEFEGDYCPAIILEAVDVTHSLKWDKSQSPDVKREFERLQNDGHQFEETKKYFVAAFDIQSVRNTQLYRTLPHEFGHYVHYMEFVKSDVDDDFEEWEKRYDLYFTLSKNDKEKFAHRYADDLLKRLKEQGVVPFDSMID